MTATLTPTQALAAVREALWPPWDPEKDWSADELETVADIVTRAGYGPPGEPEAILDRPHDHHLCHPDTCGERPCRCEEDDHVRSRSSGSGGYQIDGEEPCPCVVHDHDRRRHDSEAVPGCLICDELVR